MDSFTFSLKLAPTDAGKRRVEIDVNKCIICDSIVHEILITSTESGIKDLIHVNATAMRRDDYSFIWMNSAMIHQLNYPYLGIIGQIIKATQVIII